MIDIILSAYNAEDTIVPCIDSILNQSYKDLRLYVFDDNSQDSTQNILRTLKNSRLEIVLSKKNIGTYAAKNFIFKNFCKSKYVGLQDADDISFSTRIEKQITHLQTNDKLACVGSSIERFHELTNERSVVTYPQLLTSNNLTHLLEEADSFLEKLFKLRLCMNGSVVFRKEALDKLGGWDGRTRVGADTDIFMRLLSTFEIHNLQEVLYKRKIHDKSLTGSKEYGFNSEIRRKYALKLKEVIKKSINKEKTIRDFYYPDFSYEVL